MEKFITLIFVLLFFCYCDSQNKEKEKPKSANNETGPGTNPKVSVKVNKKYDSKGNLIKFDSTYSYYYSSKGRDSSRISLDTMFSKYKTDFPMGWRTEFEDIFMNDSLIRYDFLNPDYFSKRFELNMERLKRYFLQMDSTKTKYLNRTNKSRK
jgi:hypothetical protein